MAEPYTHFKGNRQPSITDTIEVDGVPFDLTGRTVKFKMRPEDSTTLKVDAAATVTSAAAGAVRYDWAALDVDTADTYVAWWEATETATGKTQDTPAFVLVMEDHAASPLAAGALTTLVRARMFVLRDITDDREDDKLIEAINAASSAIHAYTMREWKPQTTAVTRRFAYDGSGFLSLRPYDLRAITSVVLYSDRPTAEQWTLDPGSATVAAEYFLSPRGGDPFTGTYRWLEMPNVRPRPGFSLILETPVPGGPPFEVSITGNWGIAATVDDLLDDVERACLVAVKSDFENPTGLETRELGGVTINEALGPTPYERTVGNLPYEARALLGPYKRGRVVAA